VRHTLITSQNNSSVGKVGKLMHVTHLKSNELHSMVIFKENALH